MNTEKELDNAWLGVLELTGNVEVIPVYGEYLGKTELMLRDQIQVLSGGWEFSVGDERDKARIFRDTGTD